MKRDKTLQVRIESALAQSLSARVQNEGSTVSNEIRRAVIYYLLLLRIKITKADITQFIMETLKDAEMIKENGFVDFVFIGDINYQLQYMVVEDDNGSEILVYNRKHILSVILSDAEFNIEQIQSEANLIFKTKENV